MTTTSRACVWQPDKHVMNIKLGDIVHVRGRVISTSPFGHPFIKFCSSNPINSVCVDESEIVHVEPHQLQVGDRVNIRGCKDSNEGEIIAIDDGVAWVRWQSGDHSSWPLDYLERVP